MARFPVHVRELLRGDTALAYATMLELRPDAGSVEEFVTRIDDVQRPEGYRLAGAFVDGINDAVAVGGFRVGHNLANGRFLYVDDLVTASAHRRGGHARRVMTWLRDEAHNTGCDLLHLDSATHRHGAHAFYFAFGMRISAFHFGVEVGPPDAD